MNALDIWHRFRVNQLGWGHGCVEFLKWLIHATTGLPASNRLGIVRRELLQRAWDQRLGYINFGLGNGLCSKLRSKLRGKHGGRTATTTAHNRSGLTN